MTQRESPNPGPSLPAEVPREPSPKEGPEPLQFARAEYAESAPEVTCSACQKTIDAEYFEVNGSVVCDDCRHALSRIGMQGSSVSRFARAVLAGGAVAAMGCLVYYGIARLTGFEFALIAVAIGYGVGVAVKWGCHGRGGWRYQSLAMVLTYLAIVFTYVPGIFQALSQGPQPPTTTAQSQVAAQPTAVTRSEIATPVVEPSTGQPSLGGLILALLFIVALACAAPFLAGIQNLLGLIIIGVGLWEAWRVNRRQVFTVSGPHLLTPRETPSPAIADN